MNSEDETEDVTEKEESADDELNRCHKNFWIRHQRKDRVS
jgi:hypothetical protein